MKLHDPIYWSQKRSAATAQPWRTPPRTSNQWEYTSFTWIQLGVSVYSACIKLSNLSATPNMRSSSQSDSLSWFSESKADFRSTYAIQNCCAYSPTSEVSNVRILYTVVPVWSNSVQDVSTRTAWEEWRQIISRELKVEWYPWNFYTSFDYFEWLTLTYALSLPVEHRPQTTSLHPALSCAAVSIFLQLNLKPAVHISLSRSLLRVSWSSSFSVALWCPL